MPINEYLVPFGSSSLLKEGKDITIISWSYTSQLALSAADKLLKNGIDPDVLILHTLNPMDLKGILASAKKTGRVLIIEEDQLRGGVGAEIGSTITELIPRCRIKRVAAKNLPLGNGRYEYLTLPSEKEIVEEAKNLIKDSSFLGYLWKSKSKF